MAPVQSRLVLAVTIPAAALAIFFSLFWLRRSSKGHPPSPPDKDNNKSKKKEDNICEKKETVESESCINQVEIVKGVSPRLEKREIPSSESNIPVESNFYILKSVEESADISKTENINLSTSVEEKFISDKVDDEDKIIETVIDNKFPDQIEETISVTHIEDVKGSVNVDCKSEESSTKMIKEESDSAIKLGFEKVAEMADMAEKLANLEIDTMKMGEVDVKERDSANHSPSENMLASPSMSNFSDAHSEGSSDSGKGHSDGTTSPSRTPAGGSSVSGDPSPSIYQFVIPQVIVGRLIGRRGVFLHEIMSSTHTSIFIKIHPNTTKLKICAIEGSQNDIDKALEMIRKKFPFKRYPKLTLERISFVPQQQLRFEDFHLQLIEGVNNDVILSSLLSPGQFFVQQPCHPSYPCLTQLTQSLTQAYSATDAPSLVTPVPDAICVCPSLGGFYRAQIVSVDEDLRHCDIKFVDYGGYLRVESILLKQIRADFLMLPFQAVECSLANVQPIHEGGWSEEARIFVHNITFGRVLQAQVVAYTEAGIPLVNLYTSINAQVVMVNEELVNSGYAIYVSQLSLPESNGSIATVSSTPEVQDEFDAPSAPVEQADP